MPKLRGSPATQTSRTVIERLLESPEPSIRWKTRVNVLGESPDSAAARRLQTEIQSSPRVETLLRRTRDAGAAGPPIQVYAKWQGAHWILNTLADIGYPAGDKALRPMADWIVDVWLGDSFFQEFTPASKASSYSRDGVPVMEGRHRRCGSQQGNALYFLQRLGLEDDRVDQLVERLLHWQWPDGGWNCDREPSADTSSFVETLWPIRGLSLYAKSRQNAAADSAVKKAAEVLLTRRLFKRRSSGAVIHLEFTLLHYPVYWHYDILAGLKVLAEAGLIGDPRCSEALDLLESKRLEDGGWPAEKRYYKVSGTVELGADDVDWGGTSKRRSNEWVTVDALFVLRAAGRPLE